MVGVRWEDLNVFPGASTSREDPPVTDRDPGSDQAARGASQTLAVACLATPLADVVLAGDNERARGSRRSFGRSRRDRFASVAPGHVVVG